MSDNPDGASSHGAATIIKKDKKFSATFADGVNVAILLTSSFPGTLLLAQATGMDFAPVVLAVHENTPALGLRFFGRKIV